MIKRDEISDPKSCLNKAGDDEPVFVLRAKDPVAAKAIRCWVLQRIRDGLNTASDTKIIEADHLAAQMDEWRLRQAVPIAGSPPERSSASANT